MNIPGQPLPHNQDSQYLDDIYKTDPVIKAIVDNATLGETFAFHSNKLDEPKGTDRLTQAGEALHLDVKENMDPELQKVEQKLLKAAIHNAKIRQEKVSSHKDVNGITLDEYAPVTYLVENGIVAGGDAEFAGRMGLNKDMMVAILDLFSADRTPDIYRGTVANGGRKILEGVDPGCFTIFGWVGKETKRKIMLEVQLGKTVNSYSSGVPNVQEHKTIASLVDKNFSIQRMRMLLPPEGETIIDNIPMKLK